MGDVFLKPSTVWKPAPRFVIGISPGVAYFGFAAICVSGCPELRLMPAPRFRPTCVLYVPYTFTCWVRLFGNRPAPRLPRYRISPLYPKLGTPIDVYEMSSVGKSNSELIAGSDWPLSLR